MRRPRAARSARLIGRSELAIDHDTTYVGWLRLPFLLQSLKAEQGPERFARTGPAWYEHILAATAPGGGAAGQIILALQRRGLGRAGASPAGRWPGSQSRGEEKRMGHGPGPSLCGRSQIGRVPEQIVVGEAMELSVFCVRRRGAGGFL